MDGTPEILPLFWLRGEPLDVVESELRALHGAGIRGFVAESRPFPDWMGPFWWETLDRILRVAEELGMQAFLFDDKVFPSGRAGGRIAERHPEHLRTLLETKTRAVAGRFRFRPEEFLSAGDLAVLRAVALPMLPDGRFRSAGTVEVPAGGGDVALPGGGRWTLAVWVVTRNGGEELTRDSANLLSAPAVRCLLDEVHAPHFERLRRHAGKTFLGFFSDEPRFGNAASYDAAAGRKGTPLPWAPGLPTDGLPRIAFDSDDPAADRLARFAFMDAVSDAWRRAFSETTGGWCRARGLLWIGHAIEDNGAHCRLGYGCGHYFRAMAGQDWAGIDTVLGQNVPDRPDGIRDTPFGPMDDAFFRWGLVRLGASCGELRRIPVFEETFGAYGWSEDLSRMKWHSDFAFVRGVGRLVPHAWSNAPFPDPDCPPHFHARGANPQWRFFGLWREYAERVQRLFRGARRAAAPAVVYHAEAEWLRGRGILRNEEVVGALARHQIDCGIVPFDSLDGVEVRDGVGIAGDMRIDTLLAADLEGLPADRTDKIGRLRRKGLRVLEIAREDLNSLHGKVPPPAFRTDSFLPDLRCRHCEKDGSDLFLLVNESMENGVRCRVLSPAPDGFFAMDPADGSCRPFDGTLDLAPGESLVLLRDPPRDAPAAVPRPRGPEVARLRAGDFDCSVATAESHPVFSPGAPGDRFAGTVAAEAAFDTPGDVVVELPEMRYGVVQCFVDGADRGTRFCTPFRFFCPCAPGRRLLRLEITNTPGARFRENRFEIPWPPDPPGLRGPVVVTAAGQTEDAAPEMRRFTARGGSA